MLTPKAIAEQTFTKAKRGGYDMQEVDTFLDELTQDYTALTEENAALKGKLKVLADKITEYRETEDIMRVTLRNAQKTANDMVSEAESKREAILVALEQDIRARKAEYDNEIAACRAQLAAAQARTANYVAMLQDLTNQQQAFLDSIPDLTPEEVAAAAPVQEEEAEEEPEAEEIAEEVEEEEEIAEEAEEEETGYYSNDVSKDRRNANRQYKDKLRILLTKLLPMSLIPAFVKLNPNADHRTLGKVLKGWKMEIAGYVGYERCVVTAGGVSLEEITPKTLESKLIPGLYFAGEVLDLDADTGGYNLQTAFSTGYLAGISAAKTL